MTRAVPRVSVLLSCRDAAETLPETIESLKAQTYGEWEVVAVDDGSTDGTGELLAAWAARDDRVRVSALDGAGVVAAARAELRHATGELVARMDADDIAHPERLARQVALLDARSEVGACGTGVRYFPREAVGAGTRRYERWINALTEPDEIARAVFVECPIAHPSLLVRRAALDAVGGYRDMGWPEDYDLVLRLWAGGYRMANVPEVLLDWRVREDSLSRTDPAYARGAFRRAKAHYLERTLLQGREGAVVWGAGKVGKAFALELQRRGIEVRAFVDLDPRKIGQEIHGAPVIAPGGLEPYRGALALGAVGTPGARAEIRAELSGRGWVEMEDFVAVA